MVGDGSSPSGPAVASGSALAKGSGELVRLGAGVAEAVELGEGVGVAEAVELGEGVGVAEAVELGEGVGVGEAVELGEGVGVGEAVGQLVIPTGTPLQVEPQPVAVKDRVTQARPLLPSNTSIPAVGAFPQKVTEVRAWLRNAASPTLVTEFPIVAVARLRL